MKNCLYCETVWEECTLLAQKYLLKGISTYPRVGVLVEDLPGCREKFALKSRYMNRGFYCPSPDIEYIITNMRRGRIAKRMTKSSRPTNRYVFDTDDKLCLVETFYPNGSIKKEYVFHEGDVVYGIVFDYYGHVLEISVEQYASNKIIAYLWAYFGYRPKENYYWISNIMYETYDYSNQGELVTEFYNIDILLPSWNQILGRYFKSSYKLTAGGIIVPNSREALINDQGIISKDIKSVLLSPPKPTQ